MKYTPQQFVNVLASDAIAQCKLFPGLFPSVAIAQSCLESNYGNSDLTRDCKNLVGLKAGSSWRGETKTYSTAEVVKGTTVYVRAAFRKYDNFAQSVWDRNNTLKRVVSYTAAGVFTAKTATDQATAIALGGWATDPKYASKLIKIINTFNLEQYDV